MNSEISFFVKEYRRAYDGAPWFGNSIISVLSGIEPAKAIEPRWPGVNTIAGLVSHMVGWRMLLIKRMQGDVIYTVKQKESFNYANYGDEPHEIWENLLIKLNESQNEIINLLESKNDNFLSEKVAKRKFNFRHLINGVIQHDIYHLGQIAILKK